MLKDQVFICRGCDQCGRMPENPHEHPHDSGLARYLKMVCARCCGDNPWRRNHCALTKEAS